MPVKNWLTTELFQDDTLEARFCYKRVNDSLNPNLIKDAKWQIKISDGIGCATWVDAHANSGCHYHPNCYKLDNPEMTNYDVTKSYGPILYSPPIFDNANPAISTSGPGGEKIALIPSKLDNIKWSISPSNPAKNDKVSIFLANNNFVTILPSADGVVGVNGTSPNELWTCPDTTLQYDLANSNLPFDSQIYLYVTIVIPANPDETTGLISVDTTQFGNGPNTASNVTFACTVDCTDKQASTDFTNLFIFNNGANPVCGFTGCGYYPLSPFPTSDPWQTVLVADLLLSDWTFSPTSVTFKFKCNDSNASFQVTGTLFKDGTNLMLQITGVTAVSCAIPSSCVCDDLISNSIEITVDYDNYTCESCKFNLTLKLNKVANTLIQNNEKSNKANCEVNHLINSNDSLAVRFCLSDENACKLIPSFVCPLNCGTVTWYQYDGVTGNDVPSNYPPGKGWTKITKLPVVLEAPFKSCDPILQANYAYVYQPKPNASGIDILDFVVKDECNHEVFSSCRIVFIGCPTFGNSKCNPCHHHKPICNSCSDKHHKSSEHKHHKSSEKKHDSDDESSDSSLHKHSCHKKKSKNN
jgi:hypothetical protein